MFKLKKPFAGYKKGKIFDSYGGLVYGIGNREAKINFNNTEWFEYIKTKK